MFVVKEEFDLLLTVAQDDRCLQVGASQLQSVAEPAAGDDRPMATTVRRSDPGL